MTTVTPEQPLAERYPDLDPTCSLVHRFLRFTGPVTAAADAETRIVVATSELVAAAS